VAERALLQRLQSLGNLSHPGLVPLRDIGPCDEGVFVAFEHAPGRTLEVRLASGWRLPAREAVGLVAEVIDTLAATQSRGIVHGNLHAGNIVLDETGHPHLTDLGLVQAADGRARVDSEPLRLGDRACRAPELRSTGVADDASDIYAVGVLLYRLLVEETSFEAVARARLRSSGAAARWTPLSALRPDLPPDLCTWVSQALSPDPNERPSLSHGLPFVVDAAPAAAGAAAEAVRVTGWRPNRLQALSAGGVVVVAAGLLAWALAPWRESAQPMASPVAATASQAAPPAAAAEPPLPSLPPLRLRLDTAR
jgi:eukaryotic-like serine/threonine-protein kinase